MRCEILHFGITLPEQNLRKKQIEPSLRDRILLESSLPKKIGSVIFSFVSEGIYSLLRLLSALAIFESVSEVKI